MAVTFGYENLIPYIEFDGASTFVPPGTPGIITATETWIPAAQRGITVGCWFKPGALATTQALIAKWKFGVGGYSYLLRQSSGPDSVELRVSDDGSNFDSRQSASFTATGEWHFACGRWIPSSEIKVWLDDNDSSNAIARASIYDNTGSTGFPQLTIGAITGGSWYFTGRIAFPFLVQQALSDSMIRNLFEQSRAMFGK